MHIDHDLHISPSQNGANVEQTAHFENLDISVEVHVPSFDINRVGVHHNFDVSNETSLRTGVSVDPDTGTPVFDLSVHSNF